MTARREGDGTANDQNRRKREAEWSKERERGTNGEGGMEKDSVEEKINLWLGREE